MPSISLPALPPITHVTVCSSCFCLAFFPRFVYFFLLLPVPVCVSNASPSLLLPADFRSLSALLSTSTSVASFASLSSDDENESSNSNNNGTIDGDVGLSNFASPVTMKQELVEEPGVANGQHTDNQQFEFSEAAGLVGAETAVDGNGTSSNIGSSTSSAMVVSSPATAPEQQGMVWDEQKWTRFNEFMGGMLSVSLFQAADVWLPVARGTRDAGTKASRLFLFNSNIQARVFGLLVIRLLFSRYLSPLECIKLYRCFFVVCILGGGENSLHTSTRTFFSWLHSSERNMHVWCTIFCWV